MFLTGQLKKKGDVPIEKTAWGYVQRNSYEHPSYKDEAAVSLDSPFAAVVANGVAVLTFLIIGDQNSGKSTFLHLFTAKENPNFLDLLSELPILSSTFINLRFLEHKVSPMDEVPFLDTDLGRCLILLTFEDFRFLLADLGLTPLSFPMDTRYIALQILEIGGDHLERLMNVRDEVAKVKNVLVESQNLIIRAKKSVYFLNCKTLFQQSAKPFKEKMDTILARIDFLSSLASESREMLLYLSRVPENEEDSKTLSTMIRDFARDRHLPMYKNRYKNLENLIRTLLTNIGRMRNWNMSFPEVKHVNHIDEDGSLITKNVIATLRSLLERGATDIEAGIGSTLIAYLLKFDSKLKKTTKSSRWITKEGFISFLSAINIVEVPEAILLQKFDFFVSNLTRFGPCIQNGQLEIVLVAQNDQNLTWRIDRQNVLIEQESFRFPTYRSIYSEIAKFFELEVPGDYWLQGMNQKNQKGPSTEWKMALEKAEGALLSIWKRLDSDSNELVDTLNQFIQVSEDYFIGIRMSGASIDNVKFPRVLHTKHEVSYLSSIFVRTALKDRKDKDRILFVIDCRD